MNQARSYKFSNIACHRLRTRVNANALNSDTMLATRHSLALRKKCKNKEVGKYAETSKLPDRVFACLSGIVVGVAFQQPDHRCRGVLAAFAIILRFVEQAQNSLATFFSDIPVLDPRGYL